MSYYSIGLMDDMLGFVEKTSISPGKNFGGKWRKFATNENVNSERQYKTGNTKTEEATLMRAYIKAGGDLLVVPEKIAAEGEELSYTGVVSRIAKYLKRFYIWVAHAWFRENQAALSGILLRRDGGFNERSRFFKNELLIKEWIEHIHSENGDEAKCPDCLGTGLITKDGYGRWQWDYCDCHYGAIRQNCLKTKTGWQKGRKVFT